MYPHIEVDTYSPARFTVNLHVGLTVYTLGSFLDISGAQSRANDLIRDLERQGSVVTQAYVFDFISGATALDLLPRATQLSFSRRVRRFVALLTGV